MFPFTRFHFGYLFLTHIHIPMITPACLQLGNLSHGDLVQVWVLTTLLFQNILVEAMVPV